MIQPTLSSLKMQTLLKLMHKVGPNCSLVIKFLLAFNYPSVR